MKVTVNKELIGKSLIITKLCPKDGVYSLLYVKAEGNQLTLCAGREELQVSIFHDAEVIEGGEFLVDSNLFSLLWSTLKEATVTLTLEGNTLHIGSKDTLPVGDASVYVLINQEIGDPIELQLSDLATAIKYVYFVLKSSDLRSDLAGIHLEDGTFTATDSIVLSQVFTPAVGITKTFPLEIREVVQILTNVVNCDIVTLAMGTSWMNLQSENVNVWLATLGIQYPTKATSMITELQKNDPEGVITIDTTDVRSFLEKAVALEAGAHSTTHLRLKFGENFFTLSIKTDQGTSEETFEAEVLGEGKVVLDTLRFRDIIGASPASPLKMNYYGERKPLTFFVDNLPWGCLMGARQAYDTDF